MVIPFTLLIHVPLSVYKTLSVARMHETKRFPDCMVWLHKGQSRFPKHTMQPCRHSLLTYMPRMYILKKSVMTCASWRHQCKWTHLQYKKETTTKTITRKWLSGLAREQNVGNQVTCRKINNNSTDIHWCRFPWSWYHSLTHTHTRMYACFFFFSSVDV